ncbi:UTRA domain-containing protein [Weissella paramesenteroides]|uniref:UTRA domain-containing protein n=1 Tax=Weissella paramesenteroides TaxID=1249 RepID=UPI001C200C9F|nr:UTRA domain-containing protein [Weissella paramesenteroides]
MYPICISRIAKPFAIKPERPAPKIKIRLYQAYNIAVGFTDKFFKVRELTASEAQKLGLPEKSFGLSVYETFYSTSGEIFDYSENVYHPDHAKFYLTN